MSATPGEGEDLRRHSTGDLVKELSDQTTILVRQEIELAKAELTQKGKILGAGAGMLGGAALVALLMLGVLSALILSLLDKAMDFSLAALIVTIVYAAIAAVLALAGRERIKQGMPPAPEETVETVKEDVQWAKSQARSARK
jgi:uncharacterized membrane protein YqjE